MLSTSETNFCLNSVEVIKVSNNLYKSSSGNDSIFFKGFVNKSLIF